MNEKKKKKKKPGKQIYSSEAKSTFRSGVTNGDREWDIVESDVMGSYTGTGIFDPYPEQDADDL